MGQKVEWHLPRAEPRGLLLSEYSVLVGTEKVLDTDGGDGCTMRMYSVPRNRRRGESWRVETVRVKMVKFVMCILTHTYTHTLVYMRN